MSPLSDFQDFQVKVSRWHLLMDETGRVDDVLAILRDYVDSLTPAELAALPPKCRPGRLKGDDDISHWTFVLAQHQCRTGYATATVAALPHSRERFPFMAYRLQTGGESPAE